MDWLFFILESTMIYTVHMVNFGINKGTFKSLEEAIAQAKALGFECSIVSSDPNFEPISVKPY